MKGKEVGATALTKHIHSTDDASSNCQTIVLVEDDPEQINSLTTLLKHCLNSINVIVVETEAEFMSRLPSFESTPPLFFIFDAMFPWSRDLHKKPRAKGYAGIRCAKAVLSRPRTKRVLIIIHSVLETGDLRREFGKFPNNVQFHCKLSHPTSLALMVRSLLADSHSRELIQIRPDIFIVHGHDDEAKETVARFVEKLGGRAVVLHEQPNLGRAIIEKFEHYSNVAFAIVLLTPDDVGGKSAKSLKQRARQNVVFELGFFFAKLGRNKVCALHKENVEIPSDIQGVIYTPMDKAGAWRVALARELKAAGIQLDYTKVI